MFPLVTKNHAVTPLEGTINPLPCFIGKYFSNLFLIPVRYAIQNTKCHSVVVETIEPKNDDSEKSKIYKPETSTPIRKPEMGREDDTALKSNY